MFDIGFPELMVVSIVALLILGPERLPEALRTMGLWMGRLRRSFAAVKTELEQELGMDDIRRQLHNESVMEEMQRIEAEVQNSLDAEQDSATENSIAPPRDTTSDPADGSTVDDVPVDNVPGDDVPGASTQEPTDQPANVTVDRANNA